MFSYTPLPGTDDIAALEYDAEHDKVYAVFDAADRLVELTPAGVPVQSWSMPGFDQEGLAIRGCELFAAEDTSTRLFKYHDFPAIGDCHALSAQAARVSCASGGAVEFVLRAVDGVPPLAGHVLLGSATGTAPGIVVGGTLLPLQPDTYLHFSAAHANSPPFVNTAGTFDAAGRASAYLVVPPVAPAVVGLELHHAFLAMNPVTKKPIAASAPAWLRFIP